MLDRRKRNRGLTLVETLLLIGVVGCLFIMLLPAIQASREKARMATCCDNIKKWGIAYHGYALANSYALAPSSGVTRDSKGKILAVDGWSWQVLVLPYLEDVKRPNGEAIDPRDLYGKLDIAHGRPLTEPEGATGTPHADVLATSIPYLLCPSYGGSAYTDLDGMKAAITNYKPLGATHIESLSVASPNPLTPKFHPEGYDIKDRHDPYHPDGSCFPGAELTAWSIRNGLSYTLFAVESIEPRYARWTVGSDAAVVGLPRCVEFEDVFVPNNAFDLRRAYGIPKGYRQAIKKSPEADDTYWSYHTYLDWDYSQCPYDAADGTSGERYGPGGNHPDVVNHVLLDGSVRALGRKTDINLYMYLINGRANWYNPTAEIDALQPREK